MQTDTLKFSRCFQMWWFTVGHGRLLLRSPKNTSLPTRIDVLFKGVVDIHLPTLMDELGVSVATEEERTELNVQVGPSRMLGRKLYTARGLNFMGYVVAAAVAWHEDECDYDEPSHFPLTP